MPGERAGRAARGHVSRPRVAYVSVDTVHDVYLAFNVRNASALTRDAADGVAFQTFLETLHVDAEESDLMELEAEELDDYVPLETLLKWVRGVLRGYSSVNVNVPGTPPSRGEDAPVAICVNTKLFEHFSNFASGRQRPIPGGHSPRGRVVRGDGERASGVRRGYRGGAGHDDEMSVGDALQEVGTDKSLADGEGRRGDVPRGVERGR